MSGQVRLLSDKLSQNIISQLCNYSSNLNGQYMPGGKYEESLFARGMCWRSWRGHNYGYRVTQMMIRPKCRMIPVTQR